MRVRPGPFRQMRSGPTGCPQDRIGSTDPPAGSGRLFEGAKVQEDALTVFAPAEVDAGHADDGDQQTRAPTP